MAKRGAFIVLEGIDRCGKTTQCEKIVEALNNEGTKVKLISFPVRDTLTGKIINDYLKNKCEINDHTIHLLFTANRWEQELNICKLINNGITIIADRYSLSGIVYSAVKSNMDVKWCIESERGLPKPDAIIYLSLPIEIINERQSFGVERYETVNNQIKVDKMFKQLFDSTCIEVDANKSIEELHLDIKQIVSKIIYNTRNELIRY